MMAKELVVVEAVVAVLEPVDITAELNCRCGPVEKRRVVFSSLWPVWNRYLGIVLKTYICCVLLLTLMMSSGIAIAANGETGCDLNTPLVMLTPGMHTLEFTGDQQHCFRLPMGHALVLEMTDRDMESDAKIFDQAGNTIAAGRSWGWREGQYVLFAASDAQQSLGLVLNRYSANQKPAKLELNLQVLPQQSNDEPLVQLYQSMSRAFTLRELRDTERPPDDAEVFAAFKQAASIAAQLDYPLYQAMMSYELGLLLRELSENTVELREEGRTLLQDSADMFSALGHWADASGALNAAGRIASDMEDWNGAVELLEKAKELRDPVTEAHYRAAIYANLGLAERNRGNLDVAKNHFAAALDVYTCHWPEPELSEAYSVHIDTCGYGVSAAKAMNNLALILEAYGEAKTAGMYWQIALEIAEETGKELDVARLQQNLGFFNLNRGNYNEAFRFLHTALDYFQSEDPHWLTVTLGNLGLLYARLDDHLEATKYYRRALAVEGGSGRDRAWVFSYLAISLVQQDNPSAALAASNEALASLENGEDEVLLASVSNTHAWVLEKLGRVGEAFSVLEKAGEMAKRHQVKQIEGAVLSQMARLQMKQVQRKPQPMAQASNQWRLGRTAALHEARELLLQVQQLSVDPPTRLANLLSLSELEFELHQLDAAASLNGLDLALSYATEATQLAERRRLQAVAPKHRTKYFANQRSSFDWNIYLLMSLGHADQAWQLSEQTRARSLVDLLEERVLPTPAAEAARLRRFELAQQSNAIATEIENFAERKPDERPPLDILQARLDKVSDEYARLEAEHASTIPPSVSMEELQRRLRPGQVVLSYFLGKRESYLWAVTSERSDSFILPTRSELEKWANALIKRLHDSDSFAGENDRLAQRLGEKLFPAELSLTPGSSLIIMADGLLHQVPFGLLGWRGTRLADQHSVQYVNSLAVWDLLQQRTEARGQGVAVIANPGLSWSEAEGGLSMAGLLRRTELPNLGSSLREGQQIISYVKGEPALPLFGADANRATLTSGQLESYRVLHFATHGEVHEQLPDLSGLLIAPMAGQSGPDFLRANEVSNMNLQADLVVLSSCETGVGQFHDGEGLLSLIQPFFIAGSRQVLASLWKVNDAATAQLMQRFYYHYLVEKQPAGQALSLAQDWLRKHPQWSHPNYWAGFALYGVDAE